MFVIKSESSQSRNVVKTSVKQSMWQQWLNFSFATLRGFFFLCKESKNNNLLNHSFPPSYVLRYFGEYPRTYLTQPALFTFGGKCAYALWYSLKWQKTYLGGEEWLSKLLFLFSLHKKKYPRSVAKLKLNHWWTVLPMFLLRSWTWEHFSCAHHDIAELDVFLGQHIMLTLEQHYNSKM